MNDGLMYLKVDWHHELVDEPVSIFMELDHERWELRKVEVYASGSMTYADLNHGTSGLKLSDEPIPPMEEMMSEFTPKVIDAAEFERVWSSATQ